MFKKYDVIIVGAGIAGLYAAINIDRRLKVLLLSKKEVGISNSGLAQGGIAAVLDKENNKENDSVEIHINDTLKAGNYENDRENLRLMVENGAENISELIRLGVDFDRDCNNCGNLALGLEGGHSRNRIVHHKDSTGSEIISALSRKVKSCKNVDFVENAPLLRLKKKGAYFFAEVGFTGEIYCCAKVCILATGGIGQVYNSTTNSAIATGDGIQFAYNLGSKIEKMSLIQFHPTAFADKSRQAFLITEAARGEGAFILNKNMERFCDELKPRDVVSRCIIEEAKKIRSTDFYLTLSHLDSDFVKTRFPMIYENLLEKGFDLTTELIPIFPCQHYLMGGIAVNQFARTTVPGLYAIGECASTGVHGRNRLASNSLLEGLVFSRLAAENINSTHEVCDAGVDAVRPCENENIEDIFPPHGNLPLPKGLNEEIQGIMQKAFFIVPDYDEARKGFRRCSEIMESLDNPEFAITPEFAETKSLAIIAYLILKEVMENAD